ncbi:hypothetical protein HPG69_002533 [Diceros bicornis minor]|uniref:Uncharacterized protein n=1 Tax=Diceros bicornis minor TaxID=77932 RepID=A0A7J7FQ22_DICBM|nr:hypothetical protein HPG69_002533 [Diceros bicornis minor]
MTWTTASRSQNKTELYICEISDETIIRSELIGPYRSYMCPKYLKIQPRAVES